MSATHTLPPTTATPGAPGPAEAAPIAAARERAAQAAPPRKGGFAMRKALFWLLTSAIVASVVASVFAGGHPCEVSTDECITKLQQKYQQSGWLGIEKEKGEDGSVVITAVVPNSPAAAAGFQAGDALVAINGVALGDLKSAKASEEQKKKQEMKMKVAMVPGAQVTYTVARRGTKLDLVATLEKPPESVVAQWIGEHVAKEHVPHVIASK
jgi:S1-C subfamily serine protease